MLSPSWNGYYLTLALLAACTLIGVSIAVRFRREVDDDLAPPTLKDLLDPLEKAYYSGLMLPSEIERIRESVKKSKPPTETASKPTRRRSQEAAHENQPPSVEGAQPTDEVSPPEHHGGPKIDAS